MKFTQLFSAIAILTLTSCDKGTDVTCKVTNSTHENVSVKVYYKYLTTGVMETTFVPGETKEVFRAGRNTGGFQANTNIESVIDSVTAKTESGKTLNRYFNVSNDWNKSSNKKSQTITFNTNISDSDLK